MKERLLDALAAASTGDFVDIRLHRIWSSSIRLRGGRLQTAGAQEDLAGTVRYLVPGHGWGVVSLGAGVKWDAAVRQARELSLAVPRVVPLALAAVPIRTEDLADSLTADPRAIPLAEKRALAEHLGDELHAADRRVVDSRLHLADEVRETWVVTSEGSNLHDLRSDVTLSALAVVAEAGSVERAVESVAGRGGWSVVRNREPLVRDAAQRALAALHAAPVREGRYPVVLDPRAAGALAHRVIGHLTGGGPTDGSPLPVGTRVGPPSLTIGDDGSAVGLRASASYDEEGTPTSNTMLVRNGVVVGSLLSRESAAQRPGGGPTGHARVADPRDPPSLRLTNTYITNGQGTLEDLLGDIEVGVYCGDVAGCDTGGGVTRFRAGWGRMIRRGELAEPVKAVSFAADTLALLGRIEGVCGDFAWDTSAAFCDGGPARTLPVTTGAPHLRLLDVRIVGDEAGGPA